MAIYLGPTRLTGTTEIHIGGFVPEVYIKDFLTYPEGQITHIISNVSSHSVNCVTINGVKHIAASGGTDSYIYFDADIVTKRGNTIISQQTGVPLTAHKVPGSDSENAFNILGNAYVYANDRGTTTGPIRSAQFWFDYNGTTGQGVTTIYQQYNSAYTKTYTVGLTAYTEAFNVNGKYSYSAGTYYIPCNRRYNEWTAYTSQHTTTTSQTTSSVTAMNYIIDYQDSWLSTGTTQSGEGGFPRSLVVAENHSSGSGGSRSANIKVCYPMSGDWTDYNYFTASTTINQWGAPQNTYAYRISSVNISQDTWAGNVTGTAYTATVTAESQYKTTTWRDGSTSSTGNWITYTGRPDMCGNQKPQAGMGNGYYFYLRDPANGTTGYTADMYYPTTSTTYGTMGVFPQQVNSNTSPRTQDLLITFGDASTAITLTQQGQIIISVSPTTWSAPSAQTTTALTVSSNVSGWNVSASTSWLHTSISSNTINVTADTSTEAGSARTGSISVYYNGTVYATCNVTQAKAVDYVLSALTGTTANITSADTNIALEVISKNGNVAVPFTTNNVYIGSNSMNIGWNTTYGPIVNGGGQVGHYIMLLTCSTNYTTSQKSCQITVTQPESLQTLTFTVNQARTAPTAREVTTIGTVSTGSNEMAIRVSNTGNTSATTVSFYYCYYDEDPNVASNWHYYTVSRIAPGSYVDCIQTTGYTHIPYPGPYNGQYDWTASWTT